MALTYRTGSGGKGSALTIEELDNNFRHFTGSHTVSGSFTVSGSVEITGSFVFSASNSSSIRWENLSTSEPLVTGSLWISGSGAGASSGSGYLMIFNP